MRSTRRVKKIRVSFLIICLTAAMPFITSANQIVIEEWTARYKGPGEIDDRAEAITIDSQGNVYVTGNGSKPGEIHPTWDYVTIKYDSNGNQLWEARFDGMGNGVDIPKALVVDLQGNVYVTGESEGDWTGTDFATVKYDSYGNQMWAAYYSGPGIYYDGAKAITIDSQGNIYVTGISAGIGTGSDYITIKYSQPTPDSCNEEWVTSRYNGPGNGTDFAKVIAVNDSGEVYVAGYSEGNGTDLDYALVKYNSFGVMLWDARYNGPESDDDRLFDMAIDASENIYVTGCSVGIGTANDYATIKYDSDGNELWVRRYNGIGNGNDEASSLVIDPSGDICVTGYSEGIGTSFDYATVKYDSAGTELWDARYNGPGNEIDGAWDIDVDLSGNFYVTGSSKGNGTGRDFATIKYDSDGLQLWQARRYNGPGNDNDYINGIVVDSSGNSHITGFASGNGTGDDYTTIKYDTTGNQQWIKTYNGLGNRADFAYAIAIDSSDDIYVTGYSDGIDTMDDYVTVKYNPNGTKQWEVRYNGIGNDNDHAVDIAVDLSKDVYVTGYSYRLSTADDYATVKYDTNGVEQWVKRYNGPGSGDDRARAISFDSSGNVYVTGFSYDFVSIDDYATIKYDPAGNQLWVKRYNGPGNNNDHANDIYVDLSGNVYVTGWSVGNGTGADYLTIKYDTDGNELWQARYNSYANFSDYANVITVDSSGNVYIAGRSVGEIDNTYYSTMYCTIKYDANGNEQWVKLYNGPGDDFDEAWDIAVDSQGNVYVTGESVGAGGTDPDYATVKYDTNGIERWVVRYNGPGSSDDRAYALSIDSLSNVYVTGWSYDIESGEDYATIKYDTDGNELWVARYDGTGNENDVARDIALDSSGNVYVTGNSQDIDSDDDYLTIKYVEVNTHTGGVPVDVGNGVSVTFTTIIEPGNTTVTMTGQGPSVPNGFQLVPSGTYYDINTTATYTGIINICINYDDSTLTQDQENNLSLQQFDEAINDWQDITTVRDTVNNIICGEADHLSYFGIMVDSIAPFSRYKLRGIPGKNKWYITPVKVKIASTDRGTGVKEIHYIVNDGEEIIVRGDNAFFKLAEDGTYMIKYWAVDEVNNIESSKVLTVKIDKTKPDITIAGIEDGATYILGDVPRAFYRASDITSGIKSVKDFLKGGNKNNVGTFTYIVFARDRAGNKKIVSALYTVIYKFSGFLPPINSGEPFELGRTIPVKFRLTDAAGNYITTALAYLTIQRYSDEGIKYRRKRKARFHYDFENNQYIYKLKTKHFKKGKYILKVYLDDKQIYDVIVTFK